MERCVEKMLCMSVCGKGSDVAFAIQRSCQARDIGVVFVFSEKCVDVGV